MLMKIQIEKKLSMVVKLVLEHAITMKIALTVKFIFRILLQITLTQTINKLSKSRPISCSHF
jgi:hypothetical protein